VSRPSPSTSATSGADRASAGWVSFEVARHETVARERHDPVARKVQRFHSLLIRPGAEKHIVPEVGIHRPGEAANLLGRVR